LFQFAAAALPTDSKQTPTHALHPYGVRLFSLFLLLVPVLSGASALPQETEKEPLGSLTTFGDVYVNDSPAPEDSTIVSGDRVRTGESGLATFTISGKGSLKLSPRTEVLFSGKYEYTAELETGSVVLNSVAGLNIFTLRIGSDVVVPSFKEKMALAAIDTSPDGSFLVKCLDGALGVLALHGSMGRFLQAGQSLNVSPSGELEAALRPGDSRKAASRSDMRPLRVGFSYPPWAYLGAAGAAVGIAFALSHAGGKPSVSPSAP